MPNEKSRRPYRAIPISQMLKFRGQKAPTLNSKLNEELFHSYDLIKLSEEEFESRKQIFDSFKALLENEFDCVVESYGSFKTGLMVHESDIDITILPSSAGMSTTVSSTTSNTVIGKRSLISKTEENLLLAKICTVLENSKVTNGPILHIKPARCPIIKCKDLANSYKIDISINQYDGIEAAEFVLKQVEEKPYSKYLATLIKYFLKRRQLSETLKGGLCSYGQFLLILNFVQLHPLIQNVLSSEPSDSQSISSTSSSARNDVGDGAKEFIEDNVGTILMDFFQFYGSEFPFEKAVISVVDVRYKPNRDSQINIEDPLVPGHNVAVGCSALHLIRESFNYSYKIMMAAFNSKVGTNKAIGELWLRIDDKTRKKH